MNVRMITSGFRRVHHVLPAQDVIRRKIVAGPGSARAARPLLRARRMRHGDHARILAYYESGATSSLRDRLGLLAWLARRDLDLIERLLAPRAGLSLLDVGCGAGHHARHFTRLGLNVCAVDLSPRLVAAVRPHVQSAQVADVDSLAIGRRFDRVLCSGVLEFARSPWTCVSRLAEHLAVGGRLVVVAPRRSAYGRAYQTWQRLGHGIRVILPTARQLYAAAQAAELVLVGVAQPLLGSLFMAWTRGPDNRLKAAIVEE